MTYCEQCCVRHVSRNLLRGGGLFDEHKGVFGQKKFSLANTFARKQTANSERYIVACSPCFREQYFVRRKNDFIPYVSCLRIVYSGLWCFPAFIGVSSLFTNSVQPASEFIFSFFPNFWEILVYFLTIYKLPDLLFKFLTFSKHSKLSKPVHTMLTQIFFYAFELVAAHSKWSNQLRLEKTSASQQCLAQSASLMEVLEKSRSFFQ